MPKAFSDQDRKVIKERLQKAAAASMIKYGIRHTTVDFLVKNALIPKGTFYLFYETREELLFEVLEKEHNAMEREIIEKLSLLPLD